MGGGRDASREGRRVKTARRRKIEYLSQVSKYLLFILNLIDVFITCE